MQSFAFGGILGLTWKPIILFSCTFEHMYTNYLPFYSIQKIMKFFKVSSPSDNF